MENMNFKINVNSLLGKMTFAPTVSNYRDCSITPGIKYFIDTFNCAALLDEILDNATFHQISKSFYCITIQVSRVYDKSIESLPFYFITFLDGYNKEIWKYNSKISNYKFDEVSMLWECNTFYFVSEVKY